MLQNLKYDTMNKETLALNWNFVNENEEDASEEEKLCKIIKTFV